MLLNRINVPTHPRNTFKAPAPHTGRDARPCCPSRASSGSATSSSHAPPSSRIGRGRPAAATRAMNQETSGLISVLKDELKYERESYRKDEALLEPPPNDFSLVNDSGRSSFFLNKEYKGERIQVECNIQSQPTDGEHDEDEEEDDEGEGAFGLADSVKFEVAINKGNSTLVFECSGTQEDIQIRHLRFESFADVDEDGEPLGEQAYAGPVFDELDETLQQAFQYYLEERGVDTELVQYIQLLSMDKRSNEYQNWLARVKDFVAEPLRQ